jgi:hypothetical protein
VNDLRNASGYDVRGRLNVGLPYPDNGVSGFNEVSILAPVDLHAFSLAGVWLRKLDGMPMPIVSVELDHNSTVVEHCINAEFTEEECLLFILQSKAIQHFISGAFKLIKLVRHLVDVHLNELVAPRWICVTAGRCTVRGDGVFLAGWGPLKFLSACLARIGVLVSPLPLDLVRNGAEEVRGLFELTCPYVNRLPAKSALPFFSGFSLRSCAATVTFERAVFLPLAHMVGDRLPTTDALNRANFISKLSFGQMESLQVMRSIIVQIVDTVKPIALMKWPLFSTPNQPSLFDEACA